MQATYLVSIRSRLFGREKLVDGVADADIAAFQSAPGFLAGRNLAPTTLRLTMRKFQSAPGFLAGRNVIVAMSAS